MKVRSRKFIEKAVRTIHAVEFLEAARQYLSKG